MSNNQKETYRHKDEFTGKLPSRMEVHSQKNRKRKKQNNEDEKQSKQKKLKISIPLILLVILLLLPGTYAVYLFNKENNPASSSANGVGEEISYEEDNSIETSINNKDSSHSPVIETDDEKEDEKKTQEQQNEKVVTKEQEKEQENENVKIEEKVTEQKSNVENETETETQIDNEKEKTEEEAKIVYHTVQKGETLFRISMQYYKSQTGIEKIKEANGITDNEIMVGQSLKIPLR